MLLGLNELLMKEEKSWILKKIKFWAIGEGKAASHFYQTIIELPTGIIIYRYTGYSHIYYSQTQT